MYQPRHYRHWIVDGDLVSFCVTVKETDLYIRAQRVLEREAIDAVMRCRQQLEHYIGHHGAFATAMEPVTIAEDAPAIVRTMAGAASLTGVGPMAAVAGAIAEAVGRSLMELSPDIVVENGGDIFIASSRVRTVGVYAGDSLFPGKLALRVNPENTPLGICTSSGTVGHSLSLGSADAAIVVSPSTALADAVATAIGNVVKQESDINNGLEFARSIKGLKGAVIVKGDQLGAWGDIELVNSGDLCGAR